MYQSIYRKYRPQTFMEIYGQEAISKTLTNAIVLDKVAHAYLFSGPRGTGKTSTAKLLAKAINCSNLIDGKICDECENCKAIKMNNHPDVIEIDAASNNGVDEVRELIENVKYAPIQGNKKVYIIDEIHMMSQGAFNALLKTLEEPPEHVVFVLATTEIYKVIPTIRSRCQKFTFRKISNHDIVRRLKDIAIKENLTYEEDALDLIATLSEGGMRDALSILEQVMIYSNNDITYLKTSEALDLVDLNTIKSIYNLVLEDNLDEVLRYLNELKNKTLDFKQAIADIMQLALVDVVKDDTNKDLLIRLIENLDESLSRLKFDNNNHLYLQLALIKTLSLKSDNIQVTKVSTVTKKEDLKDEVARANEMLEATLYGDDKPIINETNNNIVIPNVSLDTNPNLNTLSNVETTPLSNVSSDIVTPNNDIQTNLDNNTPLEETIITETNNNIEELNNMNSLDESNDYLDNDIINEYQDDESQNIVEDITLNEINDLNRQISAVIDGDINLNNSNQDEEEIDPMFVVDPNQVSLFEDDTVEIKEEVVEVNSNDINQESLTQDVMTENNVVKQTIEEPIINEVIEENITIESNNNKSNFIVDNDVLLNVLVQAKRDYLTEDKERWTKLENYLMNVNTKKWAGMLVDTIPVVSSDEAIVVACLSSENVDLINNENNIHHIRGFLNEAISKEKYCFAITKEDWIKLRDYYMVLRNEDKLPQPYRIDIPKTIDLNKVKEPTIEDSGLFVFSKNIFEDKLQIITEENENEY